MKRKLFLCKICSELLKFLCCLQDLSSLLLDSVNIEKKKKNRKKRRKLCISGWSWDVWSLSWDTETAHQNRRWRWKFDTWSEWLFRETCSRAQLINWQWLSFYVIFASSLQILSAVWKIRWIQDGPTEIEEAKSTARNTGHRSISYCRAQVWFRPRNQREDFKAGATESGFGNVRMLALKGGFRIFSARMQENF